MAALRVISADSHMMEPAELWISHLDKKFQDRAPKVIPNPKKPGLLFVAPGVNPFPVAATYKLFGADNYMWASDFPHTDSTWPNSLKVIEHDFAGVPQDVTHKILFENAAKLYRIDLN